jgi:hypothetical protein
MTMALGQDRLSRALDTFLRAYQARPDLVVEQRGWSPFIRLSANDEAAEIGIALCDGRVARVGKSADAATLEIAGTLETLCDVLELRRDPNEPYLFGELVVRGSEADFVRLDYIASRLCPR